MGVIFNNLWVGGLDAGDRELEEGRGLGSGQLGHSDLEAWPVIRIWAEGRIQSARLMGKGAEGWNKDEVAFRGGGIE